MTHVRTLRSERRAATALVALAAMACLSLVPAVHAQEPIFEPRSEKPSTGNRPGFTYRSFWDLFSHCRLSCETACLADSRCKAWTCYHPSGLFEPEAVAAGPVACHLKSETPPLSPRWPKVSHETKGNGVVMDSCYTSSHAVRLSGKPDSKYAGYSQGARVWPDPNVAASIAAELAAEGQLLAQVERRLREQQVGIIKPADRIVVIRECVPRGAAGGQPTPPGAPLGSVLILSEYGFTGEFRRRGAETVWTGHWPGGCESTTFTLASSPSVTIEGHALGAVNVILVREDGDERACPYSPRLRAEYHLTAAADGDRVTLRGRRLITDPGTKGSLSWLKNSVADVSGNSR